MKIKAITYATLLFATSALFISSCKKTVTPTIAPLPVTSTPKITTAGVTAITEATATCGGSVLSEGASALLSVGVCWDTLTAPTLLRPHTVEGAGTGSFTSKITGLKPNTTYYVRAYATNFSGTAYGQEMSFKTSMAWTRINTASNPLNLFSMINSGSGLLAVNEVQFATSVISSNDNGVSWTNANNGMSGSFTFVLFDNGTATFAVTGSGLYKSVNNGQQWTLNSDNTLSTLNCFASHNGSIIGGSGNGIRISSASGNVWTTSNTGLGSNKMINALLSTGSALFAATPSGCYKSTNGGSSWAAANTGLGSTEIGCFGMVNSTIFAASNYNNTTFSSSDNGATWTQVNGLNQGDIVGFVTNGNTIYAYGNGNGVFASSDNGVTWTSMNKGLPNLQIRTMVIKGSSLILNAEDGGVYTFPI